MDFISDLKTIVTSELARFRISFDPASGVQELLLLILNHDMKRISQAKRTVHCSAEFNTELKNLNAAQQAAAKAIHNKFTIGDDVSGHLSRSSGADRAADVDQLLADWGIYHIHISNHKAKPTDDFLPAPAQ